MAGVIDLDRAFSNLEKELKDVNTGKLATQFVFQATIPAGFCFEHPVGWAVEVTGISRLVGIESGRKIYSHQVRFTDPKCPMHNSARFVDMRYYYFFEKDKKLGLQN